MKGLKGGLLQGITEFPLLEGSHEDHQVQLSASCRTSQNYCAPSCWVGPAVCWERILGSAQAEVTCGCLSNVFPCVRLSLQRKVLGSALKHGTVLKEER